MHSYFGHKERFGVKTSYLGICFLQTYSFSLHTMLIDGLESCRSFVDYCDGFFFISCLDFHSDGTHSGSIGAKILQIFSDEEIN